MAYSKRDIQLAYRAKRHGARYSLRIVLEARRAGIPISLGFALVEAETGFRNVFGHDTTIFAGAGTVTRAKYLRYKAERKRTGAMQGVGPCQLTWYAYQDDADKRGGCWIPRHNIAAGFDVLAANIKAYGRAEGIARYNGTGPAAARYSRNVRQRAGVWHSRLT